jgi:tryptophan-rich sensory protein
MFFMIGADKFLSFLEPPCSLESSIPSIVWSILGVMQIAAGILIWSPKYRKSVAGFFFVFMLVFTMVHIVMGTYDIGGSVFMAVLLGLLVWSPSFLRGKGN